MKIACLGGGPAGPLFRDQHEAARCRARHHRIRAQPAGRHVRLGRGVLRRDIRQHRRQRSAAAPTRSAPTLPIGTTSRFIIAARRSYRPATAFPASRASSCSCCCSSARANWASTLRFQTEIASAGELAKSYDLVVAADGLNSRTRTEFAAAFQARHRYPQEQVRLARHASEIRRRLHLHLRRDRARLDLGACLPVRRRHRDVHRRVLGRRRGKNSASAR